jgi:hypothetical protein
MQHDAHVCRLDLHERRPAAPEEGVDSVQEPDRISTDADVAVGQQDVVPLTRPGHRAEDITQHRLRTARPCLPHALSGHVDAHRDQPAGGQGAH